MTTIPKIFDVDTGEWRPVTQEEVSLLFQRASKRAKLRQALANLIWDTLYAEDEPADPDAA